MKIALLIIGDEILTGEVIDKNTSALAMRLQERGFTLSKVVVCKDSYIEESLEPLAQAYDLVITSGGLGCTHDDKTRGAVAKVLQTELIIDKVVEEDLAQRFAGRGLACHTYATVPRGMIAFKSKKHIAPALYSKERGILVLPGVPHEFSAHLDLYLEEVVGRETKGRFARKVNYIGLKEEDICEILESLQASAPSIEIGSYPGMKRLRVVLRGNAESQVEFDQMVLPLVSELVEAFPNRVFPSANGLIEEALHNELLESGKTLALAESCSGGAMAARLTKLPGTSNYLYGSMVTYADEAKIKVLGVSEESLLKEGAVSESVAKQMADGLLARFNVDYAISITGIAGPDGGSEEKPVGTVYGAIGIKGKETESIKIPLRTEMPRAINIDASVTYLFGELFRSLVYELKPFSDDR